MTDTNGTRKGLLQRIGSEALVTLVIAAAAVAVTLITFKTHVQDFEVASIKETQKLEARIEAIEGRERNMSDLLARVDTKVERLHMDLIGIRDQVHEVLSRLPALQLNRE